MRYSYRWEDNIETDLKGIGWRGAEIGLIWLRIWASGGSLLNCNEPSGFCEILRII
jgi:hypothetical protein